MSSARIFVSYPLTGDEQGAECARRFIADLKASGAEVITDSERIPDANLVSYLTRELGRCDYFILIQTPQALRSLRVQGAVNLALQVVAQKRMKGVLRLIATPSDTDDEPPLWITPRAFDASRDYPRARDRMLLELGLLNLDAEEVELVQSTPLSSPTSAPTSRKTSRSATGPVRSSPASPQHDDRPTTPPWKAGLTGRRLWLRLAIGIVVLALVLSATLIAVQAVRHRTLTASQVQRTATSVSTPAGARPTATTATTPGAPSGINPQSTIDPYGAGNTLALSNDLTSGNNSTPYQWNVSPGGQAHGCYFIHHTYDMSSQGPNYCLVENTNFANFVYQIQMKVFQGQAGGIIFRANDPAGTYYNFEITTGGRFFVLRSDSLQTATVQLSAGRRSAIHTGSDASNIIAVDASGNVLTFYVNATAIAQIIDSHYHAGNIGVIVGQPNDESVTEAAYTYARVWTA